MDNNSWSDNFGPSRSNGDAAAGHPKSEESFSSGTPGDVVAFATKSSPNGAGPRSLGHHPTPSGMELAVIGFSSYLAFDAFWTRSVLSIVIKELGQELNLSHMGQGELLSAFFSGYILSNLSTLYLLNRFGLARLLMGSVMGSSFFTMALPVLATLFGATGISDDGKPTRMITYRIRSTERLCCLHPGDQSHVEPPGGPPRTTSEGVVS